MSKLRLAFWIATALALFALGVLSAGWLLPPRGERTASSIEAIAGAPLGSPFALVDGAGTPVTEAIFRGKPSVTLFGYTHCPDICPTGLSEMARWADELGSEADKLRFVFVTVDPERDTQAVVHDYVGVFSDRILGVTGEPGAVHRMITSYHIYSRKVPLEGGDYSMDHTASMVLQDADGNFAGTIGPEETHEAGLAKLRHLVAE